jgi:hypothetical protein
MDTKYTNARVVLLLLKLWNYFRHLCRVWHDFKIEYASTQHIQWHIEITLRQNTLKSVQARPTYIMSIYAIYNLLVGMTVEWSLDFNRTLLSIHIYCNICLVNSELHKTWYESEFLDRNYWVGYQYRQRQIGSSVGKFMDVSFLSFTNQMLK